jgi:hypothetical protein
MACFISVSTFLAAANAMLAETTTTSRTRAGDTCTSPCMCFSRNDGFAHIVREVQELIPPGSRVCKL